ncbi:hypothetical protein H6F78_17010 [Coleofasciculus sp. FACHB-64]|uniref:hypothetical protein n=1 Tax=Cyanophyceae TaxID=3028117 RepID=UPI001685E51F|nr:hypothetical protein [Coleofasciculus sp. FACHB-64]MBD2047271.1 hypothetical protein [Coleofasciculus sp. FACHB-64]
MKYARITWDGCSQPLKILALMAEPDNAEASAMPEVCDAVLNSNWGLILTR